MNNKGLLDIIMANEYNDKSKVAVPKLKFWNSLKWLWKS
jgi:hypothetical protein